MTMAAQRGALATMLLGAVLISTSAVFVKSQRTRQRSGVRWKISSARVLREPTSPRTSSLPVSEMSEISGGAC